MKHYYKKQTNSSFSLSKNAKLKGLSILCLLLFSATFSQAAYYWQVSEITNFSSGGTYEVNETANPLILNLNQCAGGISQPHNSTVYNIEWYVNSTNSTVGGTLVHSAVVGTPWAYTTTQEYVPPTNVEGTFYYYAVLSNPSMTTCGFTTTLTSSTAEVIVTSIVDLDYNGHSGVNGGQTASVTLNNLSTCQLDASLFASAGVYNGVSWSSLSYTVYVNGVNIGTFADAQTHDLNAYIPITSVQVTSNAGTWHTADATLTISSPSSTDLLAPDVENVHYCQGEATTALDAQLSGNGATLKWYLSVAGTGYSATAPTPSSGTVGSTSYWVSQADASGCEGPRSEIVVTVGSDNTGTDNQIACGSYTWIDGVTYTESNNTATYILTNSTGCDSLVTLNLTINNVDASVQVVDFTITADASGAIYQWVDCDNSNAEISGEIAQSFTATENGTYAVTVTENGCTVTSDCISLYPNTTNLDYSAGTGVIGGQTASITLDNLSTCQAGASLFASAGVYNGVSWSSLSYTVYVNGVNIGTFADAQTHDLNAYIPITSVQVTSNAGTWHTADATLTISSPSSADLLAPDVENVHYCQGEATTALDAQLSGNGATLKWYLSVTGAGYSATAPTPSSATVGSTSYWVSQADASGCEGPRSEIVVTVGSDNTGTDNQIVCGSHTWIDGITYTESNNTATYILTNSTGCDSLVTLNLTVNPIDGTTDVQSACESFTWIDGVTYTESNNTATFLLSNQAGCDSLVTLNLTVTTPNATTDVINECGGVFTWIDGVTYTESNNTATFLLTNQAGCDSLVTLDLTLVTNDNSVSIDGITLTATLTDADYQWIDCGNGNAEIDGATSQTFTAESNGEYAVIITHDGCTVTSDCITINTVGLNNNSLFSHVNIYPNPSQGKVYVNLSEHITNAKVRLLNVLGQEISQVTVVQNETILFELEGESGIYFIEITATTNQKEVFKVVKH